MSLIFTIARLIMLLCILAFVPIQTCIPQGGAVKDLFIPKLINFHYQHIHIFQCKEKTDCCSKFCHRGDPQWRRGLCR